MVAEARAAVDRLRTALLAVQTPAPAPVQAGPLLTMRAVVGATGDALRFLDDNDGEWLNLSEPIEAAAGAVEELLGGAPSPAKPRADAESTQRERERCLAIVRQTAPVLDGAGNPTDPRDLMLRRIESGMAVVEPAAGMPCPACGGGCMPWSLTGKSCQALMAELK